MSGSEIFDTYETEYATLYDSIIRRINSGIASAPPGTAWAFPSAILDEEIMLWGRKGSLHGLGVVRYPGLGLDFDGPLSGPNGIVTDACRHGNDTNAIEQKVLLINQTKRELDEADEIISQMEMEVLSMAGPQKSHLSRRVKEFKEEIKRARRDLSKPSSLADRDLLLGSSSSTIIDVETDQRGRLLAGTERLQDGSRRLENAKRLALEAETMGISTLNDLNSQREQITRTRDTLSNADTWVTRSQGVLRGMQRQLQANRLMTYGIIAILVLLIIAVIYLKYFF
ncbi:hypothetical protein HDU97_006814 [Phlyctochytrium planicorne]|nr:hypothetical protein HDU97_006814 [Phlyctochytrium planicorne]